MPRLISVLVTSALLTAAVSSPAHAEDAALGSEGPSVKGGHVYIGDTVIVSSVRGGAVGYDGNGRKVSTGSSSGKTSSGKPISCVGVLCRIGDPAVPGQSTGPAQVVSLEQIAISVATQIYVPTPAPKFGPDPSGNEWKMLAVGYPIWLWTDQSGRIHSTQTVQGISVYLFAEPLDTSFDMGDGHAVRCESMTPYSSAVKPGTPSPTCGYTYQRPSRPAGDYTVTATTRWRITWSAVGQSGTFEMNRSGSRQLPIGEIHAVVNR